VDTTISTNLQQCMIPQKNTWKWLDNTNIYMRGESMYSQYINYCYTKGHCREGLLLYTWTLSWTSTVVYMVIVVNVYSCIHGHRCERLLLYTWSSLWTSTVVYMDNVVNVYCCIHSHRCERLLLYTWSSLCTSTVV
jgi:hypothetical protein